MTPNQFRKMALALPEAEEQSHMNHPDFRVKGKIFASLCEDGTWAMLSLTPEAQATLIKAMPGTATPANGAWGKAGATLVTLKDANKELVQGGLLNAWRKRAPKKLVEQMEG